MTSSSKSENTKRPPKKAARKTASKSPQQPAADFLARFNSQHILASLPEGANILDLDCRIVFQNDSSLSLLGNNLGKKGFILTGKDNNISRKCSATTLFPENSPGKLTHQFNKSDTKSFFEITASPLCDESGAMVGVLELIRDISAQKDLENKMSRAKIEWEETFDILNDMITIHDTDYNVIRANHAAESMLGLPLQKILKKKCYESYHGTPFAPANCPSCGTLKTKKESTSEIFEPYLKRHLEIKALPRFDDDNNLIGVVHVARDISERKKAEEEQRYQIGYMKILSDISARFINLDPVKIERDIGDALAEIGTFIGVDRCYVFQLDQNEESFTNILEWCGEGVSSRMADINKISVSDLPWFTKKLQSFKTLNVPSVTALPSSAIKEKQYLRRSGVRSFLVAPKKLGDRLVGFVGYDSVRAIKHWSELDVSNLHLLTTIITQALERKRIESVLLESEERFRQMTENIEAVFWIYSPDETRMLYVSPAYERIWGQSCESLYADPRSWQEAIHRQDSSRLESSFRERRRSNEEIYRIVQPGGEIRWIRDRAFPLENSEGETYRIVGIAEDITKIKDAEDQLKDQFQQLMQADKMIALGTLVTGVAHEINNPNNFIMLNTPLLRSAWEGVLPILDEYYDTHGNFMIGGLEYKEMRDAVFVLINGIKEGSSRIKTIVSDLKDFARKDVADTYQSVDINAVVRVASTLVGNLLKNATQDFSIKFGKELPQVHGNAQQLEQVIINLIQNACQALPNKKRAIRVITEFDEAKKNVIVNVRDRGAGIAPDILPLISDPFFTTKRNSGGTGLGLSISSRIIREHHGTLTFESKSGKGTIATVTLPASQETNQDY